MSSTIASSFTSCLLQYEQLIIIHTNGSSPLHGQVQLSALQDELGRFKVWAGNIAAHKSGRSSLDFRLRDATPLRERVIGLLNDISELLQEACQISSGGRPPRDQIPSDADSSSDEEEMGEGTSQLKRVDSSQSITELQQIFEDVITCIDCLYRLSMTIRNGVAAHDRLVKAGTIDTTFYEVWDIKHVKEKFPAIQEFLASRLGKAISRRRQYFKYYEKHSRKLGQDINPLPKSSNQPLMQPVVEPVVEQTFQAETVAESHVEITTLPKFDTVESIVATTVLTQTTASEFVGASNDFEVESDGGQTSTSYATSASNGARLSLPPLPHDAKEGRPFPCPYCFTIISIRSPHAWKRHIFRDLQPYICTFDKCEKGYKTYESRHEWFDHELQIHRKEWFCTADCQESFKVQSDFEEHMKAKHAISAPHQLAALAEMCQSPIDENGESQCSLCLETMVSTKQLCRHLARHLEDLALFSLPHRDERDEQDQLASDKVQASEVSQDISDGSLGFSSIAKSEPASIIEDNLETIPDILREFTEKETPVLDKPFFDILASRLSKIAHGEEDFLVHEDTKVRQLFTNVSSILIERKLQSVINSQQQTGDLLLTIYVLAKKCYQQKPLEDEPIWEGLVDRVRALFVNLISDCVNNYNSDENFARLISDLANLEGRLLSRSKEREKLGTQDERSKGTELVWGRNWFSFWDISQNDLDNCSRIVTDAALSNEKSAQTASADQRAMNSAQVVGISPQPIRDAATCLKDLTSYQAFTIKKAIPPGQEKPTWARAEVIREKSTSSKVLREIKRLGERAGYSVSERKASLAPFIQEQISKLMNDLATREEDSNFEWSLVQLDTKTRTVSENPAEEETLTLTVYTSRAPLEDSDPILIYQNLERNRIEGLQAQNRPPPLLDPQTSDMEVERQIAIHDMWISEQAYSNRLDTSTNYFRHQLLENPSRIVSNKITQTLVDVFQTIENIGGLHRMLASALETRINTQGPWVKEIADLFSNWISPAATHYTRYAELLPISEHLTNTDMELRNCFLSESSRSNWLGLLQSPAMRIHQYSHMLAVIEESIPETSVTYGQREEKRNIQQIMLQLKSFTEQFNKSRQGADAKIQFLKLKDSFIFRPGSVKVDLHLNDEKRRLLYKGRVERLKTSASEVSFTTYAFLFDNYLVLAKVCLSNGDEKYEISKPPIPMSLLMLEDMKHGIPSTHSVVIRNQGQPPVTVQGSALYPFQIKHLGKLEIYTLLPRTEQERIEWRENIVNAKAMHATALQEQSSEPFSLKVLGDFEVAQEGSSPTNKYIRIQGSPLFQAIVESNAICVSIKPARKINCGTCFRIYSSPVLAIGTDNGLFVVKTNRAALEIGWQTAKFPNVKQIHGLEKSDTILVLASEQLFRYRKKWFFAPPNDPRGSAEVAPPTDINRYPEVLDRTLLSSDFFTAGIMKGKLLLFCVNCEVNSNSNIEILELLGSDAVEKRSSRSLLSSKSLSSRSLSPSERFLRYDRMTLTKNCFGLTLFSTSITIITDRGFEITTLDKKLPQSVPDVQAHVAIKKRLSKQNRALGLFRVPSAISGVTSQDFICVYDSCAVYIDKHGDIQRTYIMDFEGPAVSATTHGRYLILFHHDFIEIRNIHTGDLHQIIAGENIRCLDDSQCGADTRNILVVMSHPTLEAHELVFELILNEQDDTPPVAQAEFAVDTPDSRLSRISSLARSNAQYDEYTASKRGNAVVKTALEPVASERDDASDGSASWDDAPSSQFGIGTSKGRWSNATPPKNHDAEGGGKTQKNKNCRMS